MLIDGNGYVFLQGHEARTVDADRVAARRHRNDERLNVANVQQFAIDVQHRSVTVFQRPIEHQAREWQPGIGDFAAPVDRGVNHLVDRLVAGAQAITWCGPGGQ